MSPRLRVLARLMMTNSLLIDGLRLPHKRRKIMEQWRDIPGYEGLYEASNYGRIRTNANKVTSNSKYHVRHWKQRILKFKYQKRRSGKSDAKVSLWKCGEEKTLLVSRLVAMTWCAGFSKDMTVDHIDGNPENNHADNLEWVTLKENIQRSFSNGLHPQTRAVTVEIEGSKRTFISMAEASKALGYSKGYLSNKLKRMQAQTNGR